MNVSWEPFWGNQLARRCLAVYKRNNSLFVISGNGPSLSLFLYVSKTNKTEATLLPVTEIMLFHPVSSEVIGVSCDSSGDIIVAHTARHVAVLSDSILRAGGLLCFSNIYSIDCSLLLGVSFLQKKSFAFLYIDGTVEEWKVSNIPSRTNAISLKPERTCELCKFKLSGPNETVVAFHFDTSTSKKRLAIGTSVGNVFYAEKWSVTSVRDVLESQADSDFDRRVKVETVLLVDNYVVFTLFGGATTVHDLTRKALQGEFGLKRGPTTCVAFGSSSLEKTTAIAGSKDGNIIVLKWRQRLGKSIGCKPGFENEHVPYVQVVVDERMNPGFGSVLCILRDKRISEVIIGFESGGLLLMQSYIPEVVREQVTYPSPRLSNKRLIHVLGKMQLVESNKTRGIELPGSFRTGCRTAIEILGNKPLREVVCDNIALKQYKDYSFLVTDRSMLIAKLSCGIDSKITCIKQLMTCAHPDDPLSIQQVFLFGFVTGHVIAIVVPSYWVHQLPTVPFDIKPHVAGGRVYIGRPVVDIHISKKADNDECYENYRILVATQDRIFRIAIRNEGDDMTNNSSGFSVLCSLRIIQSEPLCYTEHIQTPVRFVSHARGLLILAHAHDRLVLINEATRTIIQRIDCGIHQEMVTDVYANDTGGITVGHGKNGDEYRTVSLPWPYFPVIRPAHGCRITGIRLISTDAHLALIATSGADGSVVTSIFNEDTGLWSRYSRLTEKSAVRFLSGADVKDDICLSPLPKDDTDRRADSCLYLVGADGCLTTAGIVFDREETASLEDIHRVCCVSREDAVVSCLSVSDDNVSVDFKRTPTQAPASAIIPFPVSSAVVSVGYADGRISIFRAPTVPCNVPPLLIGSIDSKDCPMTKCAVSLLCTAEVEPCKLEVLAIYTNGFVRKFHVNYFMRDSMQHPDGIISSKGENTASSMFQSSVTAHSDCSPTSDFGAPRQKEGVSCNCKPIKRDLITCGAELRFEYKEDCCDCKSVHEPEDTHLIVLGCESGRLTGTIWQPLSFVNNFPQHASTLTTMTSHVLQVEVHESSKKSEYRCVALCMDGSITLLKLRLAVHFVNHIELTKFMIESGVLSTVYTSVHRPSSFSRIHSKHERYAVAGHGIEIVRLWEFQEL